MTPTVACLPANGLSVAEQLALALDVIGGIGAVVDRGARVLVKPNFVGPFEKAATSFELIEAIVGQVRDAGGVPFIAESAGFEFSTEATFRAIGACELAQRLQVELLNLDEHPYTRVSAERGPLRGYLVSTPVLHADRVINVPRLKGHSLTQFTFGMKNLMGCVARETRRRIHAAGLSSGIVELNRIIRTDLCIVDGLSYLGRAVFDTEQPLGVLVAGTDVVATDIACCKILNIDYRRVRHIRLGARRLRGCNRPAQCEPEIVGEIPSAPPARLRNGLAPALHRAGIWGVYAADCLYSALFGGTVIPRFHYYAGVRPRIDKRRCNRCGECAGVCPVSAINLDSLSIDSQRCMYVRCFKCADVCPRNGIAAIGLRKPSAATAGQPSRKEL